MGASQNNQNCLMAQPPTKIAGPVCVRFNHHFARNPIEDRVLKYLSVLTITPNQFGSAFIRENLRLTFDCRALWPEAVTIFV